MALFYRNLWVEKRPPLEALRRAQLFLYHHPGQMAALARRRGADFADPEPLPAESPAKPEPAEARQAPVSRWAAFVLSGGGR